MKKFLLLGALLIGATVIGELQAVTATSRSYFSMPSRFRQAMPVYVSMFRNDRILYKETPDDCSWWRGGSFEAVVYGGNVTLEGSEKLARYFLPPGCINNCLNVREEAATITDTAPGKNLEATHFNIVTNNHNFASRICIKPEHNVVGVGFALKKVLKYDSEGLARWWFEAMVPVERVETKLNLCETVINNGGGPLSSELGLDNSPHVPNMTAAFKQPSWKFGRIDNNCNRKATGVADVMLMIGYNSIITPIATLNSWVGGIIPTGTKIDYRVASELFPAVVGNNYHWGFCFGGSVGFTICETDGWCASYLFDSAGRYLFAGNEVRSFDLIGKPWGRYQATYSSPEQASQAATSGNIYSGTSGINVFTKCVQVIPHFNADLNTAILIEKFRSCGDVWLTELGYNVYTRQSEAINFINCNATRGLALKAVQGEGSTTTARNIKDNYPGCSSTFENAYKQISLCDVDLESASHPAFLTFTLYGAFGYQGSPERPFFVSIGASYEAAVKAVNTAIDRWTAWGKIGFSF